jgi:membrane associated rhomboid family serine protease
MLLLVIAGHIYLKYKSGKSLLATYLIGGICGNLLFQLLYNISPVLRVVAPSVYIVGSSGAVLAILIAITLCQPNYPINLLFFGQIRLKWVTLILIGFLLIPLVNCDFRNIGGHFAHLGGALYGASVALWSHWGQKIFTRHHQKKKKKFYTSYQAGTPYTTPSQDDNEKRVEEILDKISKDGYSALSKEEKDFLFHYKKN